MTGFDYTVIAIVVMSMLLGMWRGIIYEALALLGWLSAFLMARWLAADVAAMLPASITMVDVRTAIAYVILFIATLFFSSSVAWLVSKAITKLGNLGWTVWVLGALFGIVRGTILVLVLVLIAGLTSWPKEPIWREAKLSGPLQKFAVASLIFLPESVSKHIRYG
ncbi:MAG: CvpA family protein [Candidatus Nitrotoga sp.]